MPGESETVRPSCLGKWEHRSDLRKWSGRFRGARARGRREAACSVCLLCPGQEGGSARELRSLPLRLSGSAGSTRVPLRVATPVEEGSAGPGERRAAVALTSRKGHERRWSRQRGGRRAFVIRERGGCSRLQRDTEKRIGGKMGRSGERIEGQEAAVWSVEKETEKLSI